MRLFKSQSELASFFKDMSDRCTLNIQFDYIRAASVCWLSALRRPTYLTEPIFVELFSFKKEIEKLVDSAGDTKIIGNKNRIETIHLLNRSSKNMMICSHTAGASIKQMFDLLLITGNIFKTTTPTLAFESLPQSTSSSFPTFRSPKSLVKKLILSQVDHMVKHVDRNVLNFPININWRTQVSSSLSLKYRQFFPLPGLINCMERLVFNGIFLHFERNKDTPYCFGNTFIDLKRRYLKWQHYKRIYSLDFKSFDQKVSNHLISLLLNSLKDRIRLNSKEIELTLFIIEYHLDCYLLSSMNGQPVIFKKQRGLMSGSSLTNLLGSLINLFMLLYLNKQYHLDVDLKSISIMGDDIVFASDKIYDIKYLADLYERHFDMEISISKSEVFLPGKRVYFLGHYFDEKGRYLDIEKTKYQLCISENFIPENVLSTNDRIWSKFCSILFKCSDGFLFYNKTEVALMKLLNITKPIGYYSNLFNLDGNSKQRLNFEFNKTNGWRLQ